MAEPTWTLYPDLDGLLARCAGASGLASLRPGYAITADLDALFALGWPHLRVVAPPHVDDGDVLAAATLAAEAYDPFDQMEWPARVTHRWLRAVGTRTLDLGRGAVLHRLALAALADERPVDGRAARGLLGRLMKGVESRSSWRIEDFVYLLEAVVGAGKVSDLTLACLERTRIDAWRADEHDPPEVVYHLGHLWLRMPADQVAAHRARAQTLWERAAREAPRSFLTRALDLVLHGSAGARRSADTLAGGAKNPYQLSHSGDGPATIVRALRRAGIADPYGVPSARLAFLAGDEVLEIYAAGWRGLQTGPQQRMFAETVGVIRSPIVERMLEDMSASSKAKRAARAMLARRAS